jgi:hypothetical protein
MDGRNGERLHFLATAQACFREAIGDPKSARQSGTTSAASNFLPNWLLVRCQVDIVVTPPLCGASHCPCTASHCRAAVSG